MNPQNKSGNGQDKMMDPKNKFFKNNLFLIAHPGRNLQIKGR
jgi:hypothetical protein